MYDKIYGEFKEHVKTGDIVWRSGDIVSPTEKIIVGPSRNSEEWRKSNHKGMDSYEAVNSFWNKLYFNNYEDADKVRRAYCAGYTDWIFGISQW